MKITKVTPRGYCKGVVRAIEMAKQTAIQYPNQPIYILGMLVHNQYVIKALETYGIHSLDDKGKSREDLLNTIETGVVIFTAHGIHERVKQKAVDRGLIVVDATCPDVLKTQKLVQSYSEDGFHILYIGKRNHPEAHAVCDYNEHITLIETLEDIKKLPTFDKVFVTNQTTMSIYDVRSIFDAIKHKYPKAVFAEEICNATRVRQEAIAHLEAIDVLIIVGDKASNNSNRLAQIGKEQGIPHVALVDDVYEVAALAIAQDANVAVSSGASTPTYLTKQVIDYLETQVRPPIIDLHKIL